MAITSPPSSSNTLAVQVFGLCSTHTAQQTTTSGAPTALNRAHQRLAVVGESAVAAAVLSFHPAFAFVGERNGGAYVTPDGVLAVLIRLVNVRTQQWLEASRGQQRTESRHTLACWIINRSTHALPLGCTGAGAETVTADHSTHPNSFAVRTFAPTTSTKNKWWPLGGSQGWMSDASWGCKLRNS
ncbi:hypothetical protein B0H14DRAFT_3887658 [Mycena olivaceomarginata]|nr:hypothetical protein B0H14DRAFT_3887658 [Mycena olivaceomarginata]